MNRTLALKAYCSKRIKYCYGIHGLPGSFTEAHIHSPIAVKLILLSAKTMTVLNKPRRDTRMLAYVLYDTFGIVFNLSC